METVTSEDGTRIAVCEGVSGIELVVLDGHGHAAIATAPETVVSRLEGFLPG